VFKYRGVQFASEEHWPGHPQKDPVMEMFYRQGFPLLSEQPKQNLVIGCGAGYWLHLPGVATGGKAIHDLYEEQEGFVQNNLLAKKEWESQLASLFLQENSIQGAYLAIVLRLTKGTAENRRLIALCAKHLQAQGVLWIAGANNEGIKSIIKWAHEYFEQVEQTANSAGCRLVALRGVKPSMHLILEECSVENSLTAQQSQTEYLGIFCGGKLDAGTEILLHHLPKLKGSSVLDVGCGAGYLALHAAQNGAKVTAVDHSITAVLATQLRAQNSALAVNTQCTYMTQGIQSTYSIVLSNPPFHKGHKSDFALGLQWLQACKRVLSQEGQIWIVANSFLKYPEFAKQCGLSAEIITNTNGYTVYKMQRL
jgi:16S rRNA (guanine1207-N2)-methyltransferase